jgi:lysophospholipase L1-like esterase
MAAVPVLGVLPVVVCVGDSLTEQAAQPGGWAALLQNRYVSRRDVLLRGMSGYNSRWLRACLPRTLPQQPGDRPGGPSHVAAVTLLIGTNDAVDPRAPSGPGWPQQHVDAAEFERNLGAMVDHLLGVRNADGSSPVVLVASPPPVDGDSWHRFLLGLQQPETVPLFPSCAPRQRSCERVRTYADASRRVVEARRLSGPARLAFVDLYDAMLAESEWRTFLCDDGVHFSPDGNKFLFDKLCDAMTSFEGPAETLLRHAPHFFEVEAAFTHLDEDAIS